MIGKRILVPVELDQRCYEGLEFVAALGREMPLSATLLHVVELNITPLERRTYHDVCRQKETRLRALAQLFFNGQSPEVCVRVGRPHQQILAQAESGQSELIVMATPRHTRKWWPFSVTTVERVVRAAPCLTLVLPREWKINPEQYRKAMRSGRLENLESVVAWQ